MSFVQKLMKLPKEIRDQICDYALLADRSYGEQKPSGPIQFGLAKRRLAPTLWSNTCLQSSNNAVLSRGEFRCLVGFFKAALQFEGKISEESLDDVETTSRPDVFQV